MQFNELDRHLIASTQNIDLIDLELNGMQLKLNLEFTKTINRCVTGRRFISLFTARRWQQIKTLTSVDLSQCLDPSYSPPVRVDLI